ncbi:MAG: dehydrogenase, partial [Pseudolabrys sp.]
MTKDGATKAAQALWYTARGKAEIRQETLQPPRPHEVRIRALFGALSRGTEALVLGGRVPRSEFERMRAPFMAGEFPFPVKYGYATVGEIDDGPVELVGRKVFAL